MKASGTGLWVWCLLITAGLLCCGMRSPEAGKSLRHLSASEEEAFENGEEEIFPEEHVGSSCLSETAEDGLLLTVCLSAARGFPPTAFPPAYSFGWMMPIRI